MQIHSEIIDVLMYLKYFLIATFLYRKPQKRSKPEPIKYSYDKPAVPFSYYNPAG